MTRVLLLVGTKKGAFILEGDAGRTRGRSAGRSARAGRSTICPSSPATSAILAGGGSPWYGAAGLAERGPRARRGPTRARGSPTATPARRSRRSGT